MIPICPYLRAYLLRELNITSTQRFERLALPNILLPYRLCHTSDDDDDKLKKVKIEKPERKKEMKDDTKQRMNELIQSFSHNPTSDDELQDFETGKPKRKQELKENTKQHMNKLIQSFIHSRTSDDDELKKVKTEKPEKKEEMKEKTKQRMNELLQSFKQKSYSPDQQINIYKAKPRERKSEKDKEAKKAKKEIVDFSLRKAAKDVAKSLGGDVEETESDLLRTLRTHSSPKQSLSELLSAMPVSQKSKDDSTDYVPLSDGVPRSTLYGFRRERVSEFDSRDRKPINLFEAPPLDIFPADFKGEGKESVLITWDSAVEREKRLCVSNQPRNYFEEMMKWTVEGKVWKFPIDNEIGLEEEKVVSFADHIFLEKHLEGWCPAKGPVRQFMELVCVGLSKNPYVTVERKRAHIEWYKNYFESKTQVLKDVGAL